MRDGLGFLGGFVALAGGVLLGTWLGGVLDWDPYFLAFILGGGGSYAGMWLLHLLTRK